ncbi:unnamed protein product [Caenorhabditis angaria]|uniref:Uncharacterized protein n=1 Tax=Caenorhabditis angaria TaxID=860376 RepID=A0A9P1IVT2_9PELO|nr:unnamed protein product [Caenorhabditis angaria]
MYTTLDFFGTPVFIKYASHFVSLISLPIYFLGFYCILYKTPDNVKSVRNCMMITYSLCFIQDIDLTFLTVPFILIPSYAGFPVGIMSHVGVSIKTQTVIGVFIIYGNLLNNF